MAPTVIPSSPTKGLKQRFPVKDSNGTSKTYVDDSTSPTHPFPLVKSKVPLLDGEHSPQNIALTAFGIGIFGGVGLGMVVLGSNLVSPYGWFMLSLAVFHISEYLLTAMYNSDKCTIDSFLLNHSPAFTLALVSASIEYWIEYMYFPSLKMAGFISRMGFIITVVGQIFRSGAMYIAQSNFTHQIAETKVNSHKLVTNGVYSICRHPSYAGFFYWALGTQILLMNPISIVLYVVLLRQFFTKRIRYEEMLLIKFFGEEYIAYRKNTPLLMPFVEQN